MRNIIKSRIYLSLLLFFSALTIGVVGYMLIEGFSFVEALYMTVITISTTGFSEVHDLSTEGRMFTVFLLFAALGIIAYAVGSISSYLLDGEFLLLLRRRKTQKTVNRMENHVIICGYGRNGRHISDIFQQNKIAFVVIEQNTDAGLELREKSIPSFQDSALKDEVLLAAGINRARALITTLPDDTDNLYVVLTAREMNKNMAIITRASNDSAEKKLRIAGATDVIKPDTIGATHMAYLVVNPDVKEFMDILSGSADNFLKEIKVADFGKLQGSKLKVLKKNEEADISIIGLKSAAGEYIINPDADILLNEGHTLIVLASDFQMNLLKTHFA